MVEWMGFSEPAYWEARETGERGEGSGRGGRGI